MFSLNLKKFGWILTVEAFGNKILLPDIWTSISRKLSSNKFFFPLEVQLIEVEPYNMEQSDNDGDDNDGDDIDYETFVEDFDSD